MTNHPPPPQRVSPREQDGEPGGATGRAPGTNGRGGGGGGDATWGWGEGRR